ncbi:ABC transporter ATP-binding protein [Methanimicrococcus blatticola]|uniref:Putative ABC transport system ATP-binding protein n=1 Tax=Methanimicrococcus blatticola TaxID=91560 RepID=A0A484F770_9EURY|nr:ABC transporter ATP-binding protein [Methanimicrococcus blatticola]MBZ3935135.1 ABC transporter ATP-binding protein [Methanimicrococcus blatticola]MCC2508768.1 ABC transporter ATP-binding protein [Methanimicrococcus blatticola]TDQ71198.1 putative ABC transport system ATP-binding protein [Methanimicrococcus blatticola]
MNSEDNRSDNRSDSRSDRVVVEVSDVYKSYFLGKEEVPILKGINFKVHAGEFLSIVGPSGSGKSTLMNLLGCLDRPTAGLVAVNGQDINKLDDNELAGLRGKEIGFIFQQFNLIPRLTAYENVMLPTYAWKKDEINYKTKAEELLKMVGLEERMKHKPSELSGGQCQRVAVARSLINNPTILLADEPTGNLDSKTSEEVMEYFRGLNRAGSTIIMITHNNELAVQTDRVITIRDGLITLDASASVFAQKLAEEQLSITEKRICDGPVSA